MSIWIDRFLIFALVVVVGVLTITAIPSLNGSTLGGQALLGHMMASGVLVFGLPVFALTFLRYFAGNQPTATTQKLGYLATLASGLIAIATVFACMLPYPSTHQMHQLMSIHGWAGFAMIPAIILLIVGVRSTRSASHPHS